MLGRVKKDWRHAEVRTSIRGTVFGKEENIRDKVVHHKKLKPYEGVSPPNWLRKAKRRLLRSKKDQRQLT